MQLLSEPMTKMNFRFTAFFRRRSNLLLTSATESWKEQQTAVRRTRQVHLHRIVFHSVIAYHLSKFTGPKDLIIFLNFIQIFISLNRSLCDTGQVPFAERMLVLIGEPDFIRQEKREKLADQQSKSGQQ